jgi:hypothetical protein
VVENQGDIQEEKAEPLQSNVHVNLGGSVKVVEAPPDKPKREGSLLDSALFNFNIAQQYIDESKHLVEHRLICFHYAVALLARYRADNNKAMIGLARQYLVQAANWPLPSNVRKHGGEDAHARIVCEAHYNIGVIDEIGHNYALAEGNYAQAIKIAKKRRNYGGVEILAAFGQISTMKSVVAKSDDSKRLEILYRIKMLKRRINAVQSSKAPAAGGFGSSGPADTGGLASWLSRFRMSWGTKLTASPVASSMGEASHQTDTTLDLIRRKLDEFEREIDPIQPAAGSTEVPRSTT